MVVMKANSSLFLALACLISPISVADVVSDLTARAEKGEAAAQLELAEIYAKGEAVAKDQGAATQWILKAAGQGDVQARARVDEGRPQRVTPQVRLDPRHVGVDAEEGGHPLHHGVRVGGLEEEAVSGQVGDLHPPVPQGSPVAAALHALDSRDRARGQEREHRVPGIGTRAGNLQTPAFEPPCVRA